MNNKKDTINNFGYVIAFLPFRAQLKSFKLNGSKKEKFRTSKSYPETKLILKTVKDNITHNVLFYTVYDSKPSSNTETPEKLLNTIRIIEEVINNHLEKNHVKDLCSIKLDDISFSLYNDNKYKKNGFLKVSFRINYQNNLKELIKPNETEEEMKGKIISFLYDVISRNVKNKFDDKTKELNIYNKLNNKSQRTEKTDDCIDSQCIYTLLSGFFNDISIDWFKNTNPIIKLYDSGKRYLLINESDWLFNYEDNDRRCYTFAYYTINEDIRKYKNDNLNENLYQITRIHENGAIRTYNDNNNIFELYKDDTSVIWGISRVGLGSIIVTRKEDERKRNESVLNNDFAFIYEFCLHQKFFSYSLIDNDTRSKGEKGFFSWIKKKYKNYKINQYLTRKLNLTKYIDLFCPTIISEFETQDIYDLIRHKIEAERLMNDAKNSLSYIEAQRSKHINRRNTILSCLLYTIVFPITISEYYKRWSSAGSVFDELSKYLESAPRLYEIYTSHNIFFICMIVGFLIWLIQHFVFNNYQK